MANRKTKYKTITHIPGQIGVTLPNGTRKTFQNSADALAFFDLNFGEGYSMEITSTTDNNGEVTINGGELPEVTVIGKAPDKPKEPEPVDPIREAIFEGRYNGRKFAPTPANIQHFLDLYESDKRIAEGYGNKAWGKVLGTHLAAAGGIYAGLTAPAWLPWAWKTGAPLFAKHVAAPTAAGMIWDEGQRALTGTTTTEQISNWLLKEKGWNPTMADMAGGLSNPGYWINFGGTGLYTRPLFNKIGLGLANPAAPIELSPTILANINAMMPKSKLLTKVIDPALAWTDRNLHRLQVATNPWLLRYKPTTVSQGDLPRFKFVDDPSKLQPTSEYVAPEELVRKLQLVYNERGWNFLQNGRTYGQGNYASATRPFDPNTDFIGFTPTRTKLNALIPRINTPEKNNPLAMTGYGAPFASRRLVPAITDYYYARTSSLSPVFLANSNRYWTRVSPIKGLGKHDFIPWKWEAIMGGPLPGLAGIGYGVTEYDSYRRRNWVLNAISSPDEVILSMPDEGRNKFTQQGVDSLKLSNKRWYGEDASDDDLMRSVYYDLKDVYDQYNTK